VSGLWDQLARLPVLLSWHLVLTLLAVGAGLLISLPAGIVAARVDRLRGPLLLLASVIQTIPGLALLALVFAVLVLLREALPERYAFSAIGFWPTIIALTMYSILPILRNTVTGLRGVDPAAVEAGRALGMTGGQRLRKIELPLALPVIVAGLRTAVVWTVGIATLAQPIGQASLGDYIFRGIQTFNTTAILVGCISAAILALVLDLLVGRVEAAAGRRRWRRAGVLVGLLFGLGLAGAAVLWFTGHIGGGGRERAVVIGTKNFAEQFVLGHWIEDRLTAAGLPTDRREGLGSMQAFNALAAGDLDVYVDYTGTLWANVLQRDPGPGPEAVLRETGEVLQQEYGITLLGSLGFQNAYALAMRRDDARARGITDIDDLAVHAAGLRLGSDVEFFDRPEWTRLRDTYGLADVRQVSMAPELMYQALQSGDVDLITAFTSDGRIAKFDLELLEDSQSVFPPYDAVLLLSEQAAADPRIVTALRPMLGAVDLEAMQRVNLLVDEGEATPAEAAERLEALVGR
jgi:osmoprotectant transport system permease protein